MMNRLELSDTVAGAVSRRDYVKRLYFQNGGNQQRYDDNLCTVRKLRGSAIDAAEEQGFVAFIDKYQEQTELLMKFTGIERYEPRWV